ncbi:MAG: prepilin-type N-terminal cleavage/methylation domain-containing protein [Bacilli bacterium]|nr:prepilin-type N-terminal cleavage/methylation domain-containing protein [Bacilli bacterium]
MNKKNKGFTLIEMLATVAIIAVVTLIATVTYTKVRKNIINRQYKNLKAVIEIAGVRYTSKTGEIKYYVQELIDEGYLDPDDETGNIYDPRDNHSLNCHIVSVDIDNTNYFAELGEIDFREKDGCQTQFYDDPFLTLTAKIHGKDKDYLTASNEFNKLLNKDPQDIYKNIDVVISKGLRWTNKQLDLTANINPNSAYYYDLRGIKYIWNNDASTMSENNTHTTSVEVVYKSPYTVEAITKNNKHLDAHIDYYFDRKPPEIKKGSVGYVNNDKDVWKKSKWIYFNITAEDDVGVDRIYAGKEPCSELKRNKNLGVQVPDADSHNHVKLYEVKIEAGKDGENGEINICAIDKLGNIVTDDKTETFKIMKIDITKPHCTKELKANRSRDVIGEHNKYQYASRTIRQYCYDNNMINGVLVVGSQCNASAEGGHTDGEYIYFQKTFNPNVGTAIKGGYITIYDKVGWSTKCSVDVYVDRKGPLCAKKTGNTSIGQTKNGGSSSTNGATTLGVGSTNNWDQRFRHITQYCYDEHVGCRSDNNPSKSHEWDYNDGEIIRTGTITLYDKVPYCSRKETKTSTNCSGSDWDSSYNNSHYNNKTVCTVGVYIDHIAPEASNDGGGSVHGGNRIKFVCSDPSWNGVSGSGVMRFEAEASSGSGTEIRPCNSSSDCNTSYGPRINNNSGSRLQFKIISKSSNIASPRDDITVETLCEDKAHNIETHTSDNSNAFNIWHHLADSFGNPYMDEGTPSYGPSGSCYLREFRPSISENCSMYNYDCEKYDTPCNSNNDGEGVSCCLQGHSPIYGCKTYDDTQTVNFGDDLEYSLFPHGAQGVRYYVYGNSSNVENNLYVIPPYEADPKTEKAKKHNADRLKCCLDYNNTTCHCGYKCTVFNCYPDNSTGNSQKQMYVCGNTYK